MSLNTLGKPVYDPILGKMRLGNQPGAGIDMSGGTISVITPPEGVPYVAGDGVFINGATIGADLTGGYRMEIVSGSTIGQQRYFPITNVTGASVTLQAGGFYKINATTSAVTLNAETIPAGSAGLEGHAQIFVAGTGYVVTGANVTLANALEPDSVNNCTLRFHDGKCIISVEDHVAGYIVVSATGTSAGSLYYGLGTASNEYISVDASLNGTTLDLGGVVTSAGEKHVVGNGYTQTVVSGGINCTSKTTFANLAANGVVVSSGTLTLGDVYIPNGATVAVSGGGLAVEKVVGDGTGVIDLGANTRIDIVTKASISSITLIHGSAFGNDYGGIIYANACTDIQNSLLQGGQAYQGGGLLVATDAYGSNSVNLSGSTITSCSARNAGNGVVCLGELNLSSSIISGNFNQPGYSFVYGNDIFVVGYNKNAIVTLNGDCVIGSTMISSSGGIVWNGSNRVELIEPRDSSRYGSVTISSGAIVDLTGNTNATPINPGGGVTFEPGGATVYPSAGSASAYMLGGMIVPQIGNTNVVNLNGSHVVISSGNTAYASGCTFSGGSGVAGGALNIAGGAHATVVSCNFQGNTADYGRGFSNNGTTLISACDFAFSPNQTVSINGGITTFKDTMIPPGVTGNASSVEVVLDGSNTFPAGGILSSGHVIVKSGAIINMTGNSYSSPVELNGGVTVEDGGCQVITSGGATVSLAGGTYSKINNDGTTE